MVKIQFETTDKANKKLEGYMFLYDIKTKADALNKLLEEVSLKEDMEEWLKED